MLSIFVKRCVTYQLINGQTNNQFTWCSYRIWKKTSRFIFFSCTAWKSYCCVFLSISGLKMVDIYWPRSVTDWRSDVQFSPRAPKLRRWEYRSLKSNRLYLQAICTLDQESRTTIFVEEGYFSIQYLRRLFALLTSTSGEIPATYSQALKKKTVLTLGFWSGN